MGADSKGAFIAFDCSAAIRSAVMVAPGMTALTQMMRPAPMMSQQARAALHEVRGAHRAPQSHNANTRSGFATLTGHRILTQIHRKQRDSCLTRREGRYMYRTFIIIGALALGGCATTTAQSENWTRTNGQPISPQQLALDKIACDRMVQSAPVSGFSGPPSRIYSGCMAERGWVAVRAAQ